jgi:transcriptional regulator with XRE-family HTH domain
MKTLSFGTFLRTKRAEQRIGLREMCVKLKYDPSNYSKIERGVSPPPYDEKFYKEVAKILRIKTSSGEYEKMKDLADISKGEIPKDLLEDKNFIPLLPAFFRTFRGEKPTQEEILKLIESIRKSQSCDKDTLHSNRKNSSRSR